MSISRFLTDLSLLLCSFSTLSVAEVHHPDSTSFKQSKGSKTKTSILQAYPDWTAYIENMRADGTDDVSLEALYNDWSYLSTHPLNINTVTKETLSPLLFLTDQQIDELLAYRKRYGRVSSLYELKALRTFDFATIQLILPFLFIENEEKPLREFTAKNLLKYAKNEVFIRLDRNMNKKQGYRSIPDSVMAMSPNKRYLGEPFYHSLRYSYTFDERLQAGFVMEKDAGEPLRKKGYDYYSAHCFYKGRGILQRIALGDFKASFGQGLLLSMDFAPGRYAIITQAERRNNGFRRHYSTNEVDYFRGLAVSFRVKRFDMHAFYSFRKLDARVEEHSILSFKRDGLHRLPREIEKKSIVPAQTFGANIRFTSRSLRIGLSALSYAFGRYRVEPDDKPLNRYAFRGNHNWNLSVDYLLRHKRVKFYGETAISKNKAMATINVLQLSLSSGLNAVLLYRKYAKDYHSFYSRAFAQRSTLQGEEGIYLGLQVSPYPYWKLSGYVDFFRFHWISYRADAPSSGKEYMLEVNRQISSQSTASLQYRFRQKEVNSKEETKTSLIADKTHKVRLQFKYLLYSSCYLKTSIDVRMHREASESMSKGWMLSQNIGFKKEESPFQVDVFLALFSTDDYTTRVYSYEKNLLYAYNSSSFYGKGLRMALNCRWYLSARLTASAKLAWVRYADRSKIGSGLEEIQGKSKTDASMNLRWTF